MPFIVYRLLLWIHGIYSLITAIWPIIDINSFMVVTGPKTDIWLVKTVSVLILAIAVFLLLQLKYKSPVIPIAVMALIMSVGLGFIDFFYSVQDVIWDVYMIDGMLQIVFSITWIYIIFKAQHIENLQHEKAGH